MTGKRIIGAVIAVLVGVATMSATAQPSILSIDRTGEVRWNRNETKGLMVLETSPDPRATTWHPIWYDLTNQTGSVTISTQNRQTAFYRLVTRSGRPDTNLLMHLTFDNDMRDGMLIDVSGSGNHAYRYGRHGATTNWPVQIPSVDGTKGGDFNWYIDGWSLYGRSGDYAGITNIAPFMRLTNATVMVWARYRRAYDGSWLTDRNAALISTGYAGAGAWEFGRTSSDWTMLSIHYGDGLDEVAEVPYPDRSVSTGGDTLDWNWYAFTFSAGEVSTYYNGVRYRTAPTGVRYMSVNKSWIGFGVKTHKGEVWIDETDIWPNHGWFNGTMDDIRIYDRVLSDDELKAIYLSSDFVPPTPPAELRLRNSWSTGAQFDWPAATDRFGIKAYHVYRDGIHLLSETKNSFVETGLPAGSTHVYEVEAEDIAGNLSLRSTPLVVVLPNDGTGPTLTVDDTEATPTGAWTVASTRPGFFGTGYRHDARTGKGTKSMEYRPDIPETGTYEVFAWYVSSTDYDGAVPYEIAAADRTETVRVNQKVNGGKWNSLGKFTFNQGTNGTVTIRTTGTTQWVIADAIRFVEQP